MFNSKSYNPADHYWIVLGIDGVIYSSSLKGFIPITEKIYLDWLEAGGLPTHIDSSDSLRAVLLEQYPSGWLKTLEELKLDKIAELNKDCEEFITAGFVSEALGAPHTYASTLEDQLNLIGVVSIGMDMPYRCTDFGGVKTFRLHTAAQLRQVISDGAVVKLSALERVSTLKMQVQTAQTPEEVSAISWF